MIKVFKTFVKGKFFYLNVHGFKDEAELEIYFQKFKRLLKESQGRIKVF